MPRDVDSIPWPKRSGGGGRGGKKGSGGSGGKQSGGLGGMVILVSGIALTFFGIPISYFVWQAFAA
jgi:hypothetical protein